MPSSTSTQRTYRYLRLGILVAVLALSASVAAVVAAEGPLTSISAVHYTAGSAVFTGSLFAIGLAFLALAGRSPSQVLLDVAALLAPLIAIIPTPVETGDVPGLALPCDRPCVPPTEFPAIDNGLVTLVVVVAVVVVAAVVLAVVQGTLTRGVVVTVALVVAITVAGVVWRLAAPEAFFAGSHVVVASTFFALIAVVSGLAARGSGGGYRVLYLAVAVLIAIDLVGIIAVVALRVAGIDLVLQTGLPLVFAGEVVAIVLFAAFWIAQTAQNWNDPDPALRVP